MPDSAVVKLQSVGSTNTEALALATAAKPGAVLPRWIVARQQTKGHGRHGRQWHSPPGNLYATRLISTQLPVQKMVELTLVAGVAVYEAVSGLLGGGVQLKWPNDLLAGEAKIAGMLIQTEAANSGLAVVIGIGINVVSFPENGPPATSMHKLGWRGEAGAVFNVLTIALDSWMDTWHGPGGFPEIRQAWCDRSMLPGSRIRVRLPHEAVRGTFGGLDETGALLLKMPGGAVRKITTGDVMLDPPDAGKNNHGDAARAAAGQKE